MAIGTILLWIVVILLAVILLVLLLFSLADFTLRVRYWDGELTLSAGVWPVTVKYFPLNEQEEEQKPPSKKAKRQKKAVHKAKKQIEENPGDCGKDLGALKDLMGAFFPPIWRTVRGLKVRRLTLHVRVGGWDAAETAIWYGKVNALLYGSFGAASNLMDIKARHLGVSYDFLSRETKVFLEADLRLRGARVLWGGVTGFGRLLGRLIRKPAAESNPDAAGRK